MSSKPKEFFERKHVDLKGSQKQIFEVSHINTCALQVSHKVALQIAKAKKSYTTNDRPYSRMEMLGEPAAKKVSQMPLSNDTVAR